MLGFLTAGMSSKKSSFYLATRVIFEAVIIIFGARYLAEYVKNSKNHGDYYRKIAQKISEYLKREGKLKIFMKLVRLDSSGERIVAKEVFCEENGKLKKLDIEENDGTKELCPDIVKNYRLTKLDQNSLFFSIVKEAIFVIGHALRIAPIYALVRVPSKSLLRVGFNLVGYISIYKFFEKIYKNDASYRFDIANIITGKIVGSNYKKKQNRIVDSVAATITGYVKFLFNVEKKYKAEDISKNEYICFDLEETPLPPIGNIENIESYIENTHNYVVDSINQLVPYARNFRNKAVSVLSDYASKISASIKGRA